MAATARATGITDTDVLVDASRHVPAAVTHVATETAAGRLTVSIVTAMELVQGCRTLAALNQLRRLLQRIQVLAIDAAVSQTAYQLMDTFFLSHGLLIADARIAATALEHGLTLSSRNIRDFQISRRSPWSNHTERDKPSPAGSRPAAMSRKSRCMFVPMRIVGGAAGGRIVAQWPCVNRDRGWHVMAIVTRGTVRDGMIITRQPLALPDGTEVVVSVEPAVANDTADIARRIEEFDALEFHGMWADREDMADSVAWVRKIREQWQQRLSRQD